MELSRPSEETFGTGKFVEDINDPAFFEMSLEDQARFLGQRAGCPVVEELIAPTEEGGRGPEKMINRYGEVNFWYGYISREIEHYNPELYQEFKKAADRMDDEPAGKFEIQSVPDNYTETMAPINALPGFSLPRMLIDQMQSSGKEEIQDKLVKGLRVLENSIKKSQSPSELMARTAEDFVGTGANMDKIIKQILGQGWMDEHNAYSMLNEGMVALKKYAPTLWKYYEEMTPEERKEKGLVIENSVELKEHGKKQPKTLD